MLVESYKDSDGRIKTETYVKDGTQFFCIAETIKDGVLITEFNQRCEVTDQVLSPDRIALAALSAYLGIKEMKVINRAEYSGINPKAECSSCSSIGMHRKLDKVPPSEISDVPVIPIFVCNNCHKNHYSLTDAYLSNLVKRNAHLFDETERSEIGQDTEKSIKTINEYIIRIFASKKISRMQVK